MIIPTYNNSQTNYGIPQHMSSGKSAENRVEVFITDGKGFISEEDSRLIDMLMLADNSAQKNASVQPIIAQLELKSDIRDDSPLWCNRSAIQKFQEKLSNVTFNKKPIKIRDDAYSIKKRVKGRVAYQVQIGVMLNGERTKLYFGIDKTIADAKKSSTLMCKMVDSAMKKQFNLL